MLRKLVALGVLALLFLVSVMVGRHYFYLLDSYYYSAEFHVNFMRKNLGSGDIGLVTDYFQSLKTMPKIFPSVLYQELLAVLFEAYPCLSDNLSRRPVSG